MSKSVVSSLSRVILSYRPVRVCGGGSSGMVGERIEMMSTSGAVVVVSTVVPVTVTAVLGFFGTDMRDTVSWIEWDFSLQSVDLKS